MKPATLPSEIDRAIQALEQVDAGRLGDAADDALRRLLPFLRTLFKRVNMDLPVDKIAAALQSKRK